MPRSFRLPSPGRLVSKAGRGRRLFKVSGLLFNTKELESLLDKKTFRAFESIGKAMRRDIRRSFKVGKRYDEISHIKDKSIRRELRIRERMWIRGERENPPVLPWIASKPGKVPKIRGEDSPLKKGIFYAYEPHRKIRGLVVGAARIENTLGIAPRVLEHGGISNGEKIAKRGFADKSLIRMTRNGRIAKIFARSVKV